MADITNLSFLLKYIFLCIYTTMTPQTQPYTFDKILHFLERKLKKIRRNIDMMSTNKINL